MASAGTRIKIGLVLNVSQVYVSMYKNKHKHKHTWFLTHAYIYLRLVSRVSSDQFTFQLLRLHKARVTPIFGAPSFYILCMKPLFNFTRRFSWPGKLYQHTQAVHNHMFISTYIDRPHAAARKGLGPIELVLPAVKLLLCQHNACVRILLPFQRYHIPLQTRLFSFSFLPLNFFFFHL